MGNTPRTPHTKAALSSVSSDGGEQTARGGCRSSSDPIPATASGASALAPRSSEPGLYVQQASFTDLDVLATILQHAACVVANAGTILLEAIVTDRPVVCVLYDEGAPPGES